MAYRVEYPAPGKPMGQPPKRSRLLFLFASVSFLLFLTALNLYYPRGREVMLRLFLAAGGEAILTAVGNFTQGLEQGMGLGDAVQAFCRELTFGN